MVELVDAHRATCLGRRDLHAEPGEGLHECPDRRQRPKVLGCARPIEDDGPQPSLRNQVVRRVGVGGHRFVDSVDGRRGRHTGLTRVSPGRLRVPLVRAEMLANFASTRALSREAMKPASTLA